MKYLLMMSLALAGCATGVSKNTCMDPSLMPMKENLDFSGKQEQAQFEALNQSCRKTGVELNREAFKKEYERSRLATIREYCSCENGYLDETTDSATLRKKGFFKDVAVAISRCAEVKMDKEYMRGVKLASSRKPTRRAVAEAEASPATLQEAHFACQNTGSN